MKLIVLEGSAPHSEYVVELPVARIGRAPDCDVMVFDAQVSRHHAQIRLIDGHYVVESLQQANPTIVNDRYLDGRRRLLDGDLVVVGGVVFVAEIDDAITSRDWEPPLDLVGEPRSAPGTEPGPVPVHDKAPAPVPEPPPRPPARSPASPAPVSPPTPGEARAALRTVAARLGEAGRRFEARGAPPPPPQAAGPAADDSLATLMADHEALGGDAELARLAALLSERLGNQTDIGALYRLGAETSSLIAWTRIAQRSMSEAVRLADALGLH